METLETQQKVRDVYMKYVDKGELIRVDGDKDKELVAEELFTKVAELLQAAKCFMLN
jgi:thymidylate kinase